MDESSLLSQYSRRNPKSAISGFVRSDKTEGVGREVQDRVFVSAAKPAHNYAVADTYTQGDVRNVGRRATSAIWPLLAQSPQNDAISTVVTDPANVPLWEAVVDSARGFSFFHWNRNSSKYKRLLELSHRAQQQLTGPTPIIRAAEFYSVFFDPSRTVEEKRKQLINNSAQQQVFLQAIAYFLQDCEAWIKEYQCTLPSQAQGTLVSLQGFLLACQESRDVARVGAAEVVGRRFDTKCRKTAFALSNEWLEQCAVLMKQADDRSRGNFKNFIYVLNSVKRIEERQRS